MDPDDLEPRHKAQALKNLEPLGVEDLERYIVELEQEIQRVRNAMAAKQKIRAGAESLFRK